MWQHRNIFTIGVISGLLLPGLIGYYFAGIAGAIGCFVWAGLVRTVCVHHGTFLINSAAHIWGTQPYSKDNSSRDSFWLAFLTFGEGYHNFHHSFQADYRNGYKWYHVDPSKWWINFFKYIGLKSNLKRAPDHSIEVARLDMKFNNKIDHLRDNNIDTSNFEKRMTHCRESLRDCLFEIHRGHKELKSVVKSSKEKIRLSIADLQQSLATIREDLKNIFRDMRKQVMSSA
jgi:stearoyl-CoA desaturase (delta-9 desaturase)